MIFHFMPVGTQSIIFPSRTLTPTQHDQHWLNRRAGWFFVTGRTNYSEAETISVFFCELMAHSIIIEKEIQMAKFASASLASMDLGAGTARFVALVAVDLGGEYCTEVYGYGETADAALADANKKTFGNPAFASKLFVFSKNVVKRRQTLARYVAA
jgi:hypothetical protein